MFNNRVSTALSALLVLVFASFMVPPSIHAGDDVSVITTTEGGSAVVATAEGGSAVWTTLAKSSKSKKSVRVTNPVPYIIAFAVIFLLIGFFIWVMLSTNPHKGKLPPVSRYEDDNY